MALPQDVTEAVQKYGPKVDDVAKRYGISGTALLAKLVKGESGGRKDAVSSAGAKGWAQFMPGTRRAVMKQYGLDPWRSADEALASAVHHLRGDLGNRTGLEGYNPGGGQDYVKYILSQKVGDVRGGGPRQSGAAPEVNGSNGASPVDPGPASILGSSAAGPGLAGLLSSLTQQKPTPPPSMGLPEPQFSARRSLAMPASSPAPLQTQAPSPAPRVSADDAIGQIRALSGGEGPTVQGPELPDLPQGPAASALRGGTQAAPRDEGVEAIKLEAERIDDAKVPYQWGGGHSKAQARGSKVTPLDCSGAVSRALGLNPRVSGQFESWGQGGKGKRVTIYANKSHVLMEVDGKFWGTSKSNPGGGAGWIPRSQVSKEYLSRFTARHPPGM